MSGHKTDEAIARSEPCVRTTGVDWIKKLAESDAEYQHAVDLAQHFEPRQDVEYGWAMDYGLRAYEWYSHALDVLDQKADSLITYLGGGVGLLSMVAAVLSLDKSRILAATLLPTILLGLWAIRLAAGARAPALLPFPPFPDKALRYSEFFEVRERAVGAFTAKLHEATIAAWIALDAKGNRIRAATRCFIWATGLLLLPVFGALLLPELKGLTASLRSALSIVDQVVRALRS